MFPFRISMTLFKLSLYLALSLTFLLNCHELLITLKASSSSILLIFSINTFSTISFLTSGFRVHLNELITYNKYNNISLKKILPITNKLK